MQPNIQTSNSKTKTKYIKVNEQIVDQVNQLANFLKVDQRVFLETLITTSYIYQKYLFESVFPVMDLLKNYKSVEGTVEEKISFLDKTYFDLTAPLFKELHNVIVEQKNILISGEKETNASTN